MTAKSTSVSPLSSPQAFQSLLDASAEGMLVTDHLGTIELFGRAAEQLFGYRTSEIIGKNVGVLMADNDRQLHSQHLLNLMSKPAINAPGPGREIAAQHKDGSRFPASISVEIIGGSDPPQVITIIRDIAAQQQSMQEGIRLHDRLMNVARLATIGEMTSGIAHELNQPLAAIATYAHACDRLLSGAKPDIDEIQGALRQIAEQAVRAGSAIQRLRNLARIASVKQQSEDVNSVIAELTELIRSDIKCHGVTYQTDLALDLPTALLDRAQIQQVVLNLVRNALESLEFMPSPSKQVTVRTRLLAEGDIEISVSDNGPGVDKRVADRLFHPFCTTKSDGTGLGLAISRTIVQAHGGSLDFSRQVTTGARFEIRLPASLEGEQ